METCISFWFTGYDPKIQVPSQSSGARCLSVGGRGSPSCGRRSDSCSTPSPLTRAPTAWDCSDSGQGEIPASYAGSGDTRGCRHLLEGAVMAVIRAPLRASGETLGPVLWIGWQRRLNVVTFIKVLSWLLVASQVFDLELSGAVLGVGASPGMGIRGAMYDIVGSSSMVPSSGPAVSCNPLADSSRRLWWVVR